MFIYNFFCSAELKATDNACMIELITEYYISRSKTSIEESNICMVAAWIDNGIISVMKLCYFFFKLFVNILFTYAVIIIS